MMEGQGEGAEASDSDGLPSRPSQKIVKGRSSVWEKVAWFTRRSRSRESGTSSELTPTAAAADPGPSPPDAMDCEASPSDSDSFASHWPEVSSSSESELFEEFQDGCRIKRSRLYPNSEIIEQNCLKPSVARALFLQIEAANLRGTKSKKHTWQKKKKSHGYSLVRSDSFHGRQGPSVALAEKDLLSRTVSMPSEISKSSCHCPACCTCSPAQRLMGMCPAHARLSTSTASLDRGLSLSNINPCAKISMNKLNEPQNAPEGEADPTHSSPRVSVAVEDKLDLNQYKSNSLPMSYGKRCKQCQKPTYRPHLPRREAWLSDIPIMPNVDVCQCTAKPQGCTKLEDVKAICCDNEAKTTEVDSLSPFEVDESLDASTSSGTPAERNLSQSTDSTDDAAQQPPQQSTVQAFRRKRQVIRNWFQSFSDEQRNLLLRDLLEECELPQMHLLSLTMAPRLHLGCPPNCQDLLQWLPQCISLYILSLLDPVSLCHASGVCRSWRSLAQDPGLWRRFCCQPKWRLSRAGEQKQLLQHMMPNGNIYWTRVFAERFRLRNNWLRGKCYVRTFEGHTQGISCVQFDDTRIVSGSSDKTIKVWNIRTNSPWLVQTLVGHSGTVRCLHLQGNRLVSGSTDRTIKVWDLSTQQSWSSIACKVTMVGHLDTVRCLQVDDEKVISGSYDRTLKVWDIRRGLCNMTLRGHEAAVLCVQFDRSKIVSGSCDKTIKVWSFTGECLMTLHGHHDAVTCLQFDETRIISGSLDCNLKFWDLHTGQCNKTIDWKASEGHTGVVRCLQADSWRVVSASDDRTLKVWNLETCERLVTLRNHTDGVTCLQFNDSIIVSGSYDKTVKLWDFSCC